MDARRWQYIKPLLAECLSLPVHEQAAALEQMCGSDAALKQELASLLQAAGGESSSSLDGVPATLALRALDEWAQRVAMANSSEAATPGFTRPENTCDDSAEP